jgi:multisubunit Na+/H+ antiporter MnhC subunit
MILAAEGAAKTSTFSGFDPFVLIITLLIAIGVFRLFRAEKKNLFAIAFGLVSLAVFVFMDVVMISGW